MVCYSWVDWIESGQFEQATNQVKLLNAYLSPLPLAFGLGGDRCQMSICSVLSFLI